MPKKVLELHKSGKNMQQVAVEKEKFGQTRAELQLNDEAAKGRDATLKNVVKRYTMIAIAIFVLYACTLVSKFKLIGEFMDFDALIATFLS